MTCLVCFLGVRWCQIRGPRWLRGRAAFPGVRWWPACRLKNNWGIINRQPPSGTEMPRLPRRARSAASATLSARIECACKRVLYSHSASLDIEVPRVAHPQRARTRARVRAQAHARADARDKRALKHARTHTQARAHAHTHARSASTGWPPAAVTWGSRTSHPQPHPRLISRPILAWTPHPCHIHVPSTPIIPIPRPRRIGVSQPHPPTHYTHVPPTSHPSCPTQYAPAQSHRPRPIHVEPRPIQAPRPIARSTPHPPTHAPQTHLDPRPIRPGTSHPRHPNPIHAHATPVATSHPRPNVPPLTHILANPQHIHIPPTSHPRPVRVPSHSPTPGPCPPTRPTSTFPRLLPALATPHPRPIHSICTRVCIYIYAHMCSFTFAHADNIEHAMCCSGCWDYSHSAVS